MNYRDALVDICRHMTDAEAEKVFFAAIEIVKKPKQILISAWPENWIGGIKFFRELTKCLLSEGKEIFDSVRSGHPFDITKFGLSSVQLQQLKDEGFGIKTE